jgi:pyruvate kinase
MIENPFPTRAEVSDIFNAIVQKTDAIMMSWETTIGKYPIEAAEMMKLVAMSAEAALEYKHEEYEVTWLSQSDIEKKMLLRSAMEIATKSNIKSIIVFTKTWKLAKLAAAYRSNVKIFAVTNRQQTFTNTTLLFGVVSRFMEFTHHSEAMKPTLKMLLDKWDITRDDRVVIVTDIRNNDKNTPVLEIVTVSDYF